MTVTEKLRMMEAMEARNNARLRAAGLLHRAGKLIRRAVEAAADENGAYWGNLASAAGMDSSTAVLEAEAYFERGK